MGSVAKISRMAHSCFHRLTHPKSRAERSTSSKIQLKLSPTPSSVSEVTEAEKRIVKFVQRQSFPTDIDKSVITGRLARLKPFEEEGILRVGGRLKHSDLQYDAKYPMILLGKHPVTELIILHYHHLNGHEGAYQVLTEIRQQFWIAREFLQ